MPPKAASLRAEQLAWISKTGHQRLTDPRIGEWLDELEENAMLRDKLPALIVVFQNFMKTAVAAQEWVAVPLKDFEKITLGWRTR